MAVDYEGGKPDPSGLGIDGTNPLGGAQLRLREAERELRPTSLVLTVTLMAVLLGAIGCQSPAKAPRHRSAVGPRVEYSFDGRPRIRGMGERPPERAASEGLVLPERSAPASVDLVSRTGRGLNLAANPWIPWQLWAGQRGLEASRLAEGGAEPVFEVRSTNALAAITVGRQVARVNGIECWLAFAPRLINGQPYVHWLDAEKTLDPLLSATSIPGQGGRVIVIDPGHGGSDSGSRNITNNRYEKEYTLDWARRLQDLLCNQGWTVYLTRSSDIDISLADRVALADRVQADLFLSLHFNSAFPRFEHSGLETYCLTPVGLPSTLKREFADDPGARFPNNQFDRTNVQWAARLHRSLLEATGAPDRGVRRARFMGVLRGQNRPAVLLEGGFLSNPGEAKRISTAEYRQKLAEAVAAALLPGAAAGSSLADADLNSQATGGN